MTEPTADDFYRRPILDHTPPGGQILRHRSVPIPALPGARHAWQIIYATHTATSAPTVSSGIVISSAADRQTGQEPVLVYCTRFHGLGGRCAPSQLLAGEGVEPETELIAQALDRGWTVAVPDGQGLGVTELGPHPFLAGQAGAHTVLDLARAARDLPDLDTANSPCVVWGYADGGRAAVWAGELAPDYAPELDLRGVAAGAVVTDLGALVPRIDGGPWAGLALAGLIGLSRSYSHLPVAHLITRDGYETIEHARDLDAAALLATYRNQPLSRWCERADPWNDPIWRYVLAHETTSHHVPQTPVHLYHGTHDALVPAAMGRELFTRYRDLGVAVDWREFPVGHARAATDGAADALAHLADFLSYDPARPTSIP
ncbi:lipase [Nocardia farcinica]|uniref:lipase family protein n=1 Tax=Nocardia farcinica TaxID=37329 RepID=UPI000E04C3A0|nr:lipase family protein [Nocardia farcinica]SUE28913.1 lipase [Nocardia farcinica]